jgi:hypothetical protein
VGVADLFQRRGHRQYDREETNVRKVLLLALAVQACSPADPGISREKAEAVLRSFNLNVLSLQPTPDGWTGAVVPQRGGYRMQVTVNRLGVMQLQPDDCHC